MGSHEGVFHQPFGQRFVERSDIGCCVPHGNELLFEGAVESLIHGIVGGGFHPRPVLGNTEISACGDEFLMELGAVVMERIQHGPVQEIEHALYEVRRASRALSGVHARKGDLGSGIDGGKDIALGIAPVYHDGVERNEIPRERLADEFRDALFTLISLAFFLHALVFHRMIVQLPFLNGVLDLPRRDTLLMGVLVEPLELHLPPADVRFPERNNALFFDGGDLSLPSPARRAGAVFQRAKIAAGKAFFPCIKHLGRDAEMAARGQRVFRPFRFIPDDPFQSSAGGAGKSYELGLFPPIGMLVKGCLKPPKGGPIGFIYHGDEI